MGQLTSACAVSSYCSLVPRWNIHTSNSVKPDKVQLTAHLAVLFPSYVINIYTPVFFFLFLNKMYVFNTLSPFSSLLLFLFSSAILRNKDFRHR